MCLRIPQSDPTAKRWYTEGVLSHHSIVMKRFLVPLVVVGMALTPTLAFAATLSAGQQYSLAANASVAGNLYVAAGTTTIGGRVTGDVFSAGGTVIVSGSVGGDLAAAGGTVQVLGAVDGDARIAGGTVTVSDRVDGDLVVLGGTAHILPGAIVAGDLIMAGGQAIVDGTIYGNMNVTVGTLIINGSVRGTVTAKVKDRVEVGSTAVVGGALSYRAPGDAVIADGARISGGITRDTSGRGSMPAEVPARAFWAFMSILTGMKLLAALGLAAVLVWRWHRQSLEVLSSVRNSFWQSLGHGLAYMILVPIAAILLLVSFVGTLPGALVLMLFGAMLILSKALTGMFFGSWLVMVINKKDAMHITWGSALGGVILFTLVSLIPIIGWIVGCAVWLAVFGALGQRAQHMLSR